MGAGRERMRLVAPPPATGTDNMGTDSTGTDPADTTTGTDPVGTGTARTRNRSTPTTGRSATPPSGSVPPTRTVGPTTVSDEHPAGSARSLAPSARLPRRSRRRVLLVGEGAPAELVAGRIVVGRLTDSGGEPVVVDLRSGGSRVTRTVGADRAVAAARTLGAGTVVLWSPGLGPTRTDRLARQLLRDGRHVEVATGLTGLAERRVRARCTAGRATVRLSPVGRCTWRAPVKRAADVVLAGLLLVLASPVLLVALAAVRVADGPGVLFRQVRVGRDGTRFTMLKVRTMVPDAEDRLADLLARNEAAGPMFKMRDDPRVTRVGAVLRATSVDELPQLWNVLRGDMSLVGPRPALPREVAQWEEPLRERLRVRPGITGPWQVHGRFTASLEDYERLDVDYVDNWSLLGDLGLLARTVPAVLARHGAV